MAVIIRSYEEALRFGRAGGADAANRRMRKAGRSAWDADDYAHAVEVMTQFLRQLGYDFAAEASSTAPEISEHSDRTRR